MSKEESKQYMTPSSVKDVKSFTIDSNDKQYMGSINSGSENPRNEILCSWFDVPMPDIFKENSKEAISPKKLTTTREIVDSYFNKIIEGEVNYMELLEDKACDEKLTKKERGYAKYRIYMVFKELKGRVKKNEGSAEILEEYKLAISANATISEVFFKEAISDGCLLAQKELADLHDDKGEKKEAYQIYEELSKLDLEKIEDPDEKRAILDAKYQTAMAMFDGVLLTEDKEKAIVLFEECVGNKIYFQGDKKNEANFLLGNYYDQTDDYKKADKYFRAVVSNNPEAAFKVAEYIAQGLLGEVNKPVAKRMYFKAAKGGVRPAYCFFKAHEFGKEFKDSDIKTAIEETKDLEEKSELADLCRFGLGKVQPDYKMAAKIYLEILESQDEKLAQDALEQLSKMELDFEPEEEERLLAASSKYISNSFQSLLGSVASRLNDLEAESLVIQGIVQNEHSNQSGNSIFQ